MGMAEVRREKREVRNMKLGLIGAGKMAEAIITAVCANKLCAPWDVIACDKEPKRRNHVSKNYGVSMVDNAADVVAACTTLILAVKPQDAIALLSDLKPLLTEKHLLISIVAGKTLASLKNAAGSHVRLIRVMPNLGLQVRAGMSVYCAARSAGKGDRELCARIFGSAGEVLELSERHFDAVTALSGSGPAFVAFCAQAMAAGGAKLKLPKGVARTLAIQTLLGTALYLKTSQGDCDALIQSVRSPGGTTAAGMAALESSELPDILFKALEAAAKRSAALNKEAGEA